MAEYREKEVLVNRWTKFAGLAYDMTQNDELMAAFQSEDDGPAIAVLTEYGLTVQDCYEFRSNLETVIFAGWWLGARMDDQPKFEPK